MSYYGSSRNRYSSSDPTVTLFVVAIIAVIAAWGIFAIAKANSGKDIASVTICKKERAATDGGGQYRIYTNKGTFVMEDLMFLGGHRTHTADDYARLKPLTTYDIHTVGWRWGWQSWFPNIMSFEKSAQQDPHACDDYDTSS